MKAPHYPLPFEKNLLEELHEEQVDCYVTYQGGDRKEVYLRYFYSLFLNALHIRQNVTKTFLFYEDLLYCLMPHFSNLVQPHPLPRAPTNLSP